MKKEQTTGWRAWFGSEEGREGGGREGGASVTTHESHAHETGVFGVKSSSRLKWARYWALQTVL